MISNTEPQKAGKFFGAGAAALILFAVLISYMLADYVLVEVLKALHEGGGPLALRNKTDKEIAALRSVLHGVQDPAITLLVCRAILRNYFPQESWKMLLGRFGLAAETSIKKCAAYFAAGMTYVLFFKSLAHFFPPDPFALEHPEQVINYATFIGKLVFAITAITLVPVSEEFLFRGVLYDSIANSCGKIASTFCVSLVFIALHPNTIESGYWLSHAVLYIFPVAMVLMREFTGTLYAPVLAHAAFNFTEIYI